MYSGGLAASQDLVSRQMRRTTSLRLRWMAIAGQVVAIVFTLQGMNFDLPLVPMGLAVLASIVLNLCLTREAAPRLSDRMTMGLLTFDTAQLSTLLMLTGGLQNPFSILLIVPVVVAAATLPLRHTVRLCILVTVLATALAFYHFHLPWYELETFRPPALYVAGLWAALVLGMAFTVTYVWQVALENRTLAGALAATELVLQREQHLTRLDGLAAAAAHELGTPLATIALAAKELSRELDQPEQAEDARLIVEQAARCRTILAKLSSLDDEGDVIGWLKVSNLISEIVEPHEGVGPRIIVSVSPGEQPHVRRNAGILYGLGNLVENAVDYAREVVRVEASWGTAAGPTGEGFVTITVADDGPGFSTEVLRRIGEPYLGEPYRSSVRRARGQSGLGLGFFIAKTLLERSGAEVSYRNRGGAEVTVRWPDAAFRMPPAAAGAAVNEPTGPPGRFGVRERLA